jgi:polyisoprenyl-phosphate glycosyltransferase
MNELLSIVSPVFEEEQGILAFHEQLSKDLATIPASDWEIIYVVDPGRDRTVPLLEELAGRDSRVHVLVLSRRFGHQPSLAAGLDYARGEAVISMDCDLQHPPALIPEMVKRYRSGTDVVLTKRTYAAEIPLSKRLPSALFHKLLGVLSEGKQEENGSDFRLLSRRSVDVLRRQFT